MNCSILLFPYIHKNSCEGITSKNTDSAFVFISNYQDYRLKHKLINFKQAYTKDSKQLQAHIIFTAKKVSSLVNMTEH